MKLFDSHSRLILCLVIRLFCLLCVALAPQARASNDVVIDLSRQSEVTNLADYMQYLTDVDPDISPVTQVARLPGWAFVADQPGILESPRETSTFWLRAQLANPQTAPLMRWLELSPWRLNKVDVWLLDPQTQRVVDRLELGTDIPVDQRRIQNNRILIPVSMSANQTLELVLRIRSDSRPFLKLNSWDPVAFTAKEVRRYQLHSILFAVIGTLVIVLLLQTTLRFLLISLWILVMFVFESEKEGYFSYLLFDGVFNYASHLRFSSSVWAKALFMGVSVYLLGLERQRYWRWLMPCAFALAAVYTALTFVLQDNQLRNLASVIHVCAAVVWPLMVPAGLRQKRPWQHVLLGLFGLAWLTSSFFVFGYIFNFFYTAEFAEARLIVEIAVILGVVLVYARQKRDHERALELQVRGNERAERRRLEEAVAERTRELNAALQTAKDAVAAKTKFLSQVTHDLKSPLTSIMGYAQLLRIEDGKVGKMSAIIHNSASHMLNMITRLIDYARGMSDAQAVYSNVYLMALIDSVSNEAKVLAGRGCNRFSVQLEPDLPAVIRCDETFLREILLNLLDNAAKSTRDGEIQLKIGCTGSGYGGNSQLTFRVIDTGPGMSPEELERVFDPFYRTPAQAEGTGLGLPIVKELIQKLGGEIRLVSAQGEGTTVHVTLPLRLGNEVADSALLSLPRYMLPHLNATGLDAWLVEDVDSIRELLCTELEGLGFRVRDFAGVEEFVNALYQADRRPDLVITDHLLPKYSGDTVLLAVKQVDPSIPVILLSATWSVMKEPETHPMGTYAARLGKPVDLVVLRREIALACGLSLSSAT